MNVGHKMRALLKHKSFYLGFILASIPFMFLNILENITPHYVHQFGFPFSAYETKMISDVGKVGSLTIYDSITVGKFVWIGLIGNTVIGALFCFLIGTLFAKVSAKIWPARYE